MIASHELTDVLIQFPITVTERYYKSWTRFNHNQYILMAIFKSPVLKY